MKHCHTGLALIFMLAMTVVSGYGITRACDLPP